MVEDERLLVIAARGASISAGVSTPPLGDWQFLQSGCVQGVITILGYRAADPLQKLPAAQDV